eukprot:3521524-Pyramimonas_sp.AAC.1
MRRGIFSVGGTPPTSSAQTPMTASLKFAVIECTPLISGPTPTAHSAPDQGHPWRMPEARAQKISLAPARLANATGRK